MKNTGRGLFKIFAVNFFTQYLKVEESSPDLTEIMYNGSNVREMCKDPTLLTCFAGREDGGVCHVLGNTKGTDKPESKFFSGLRRKCNSEPF